MVGYRGPQANRINDQFREVQQYAGETGIWKQYLSASSGNVSAWLAGGGTTQHYRWQVITALWAAPQMGESRYREYPTPAGEMIAGEAVISTTHALSMNDEIVWRGVAYRVNSDPVPIVLGGRRWWRTLVKRGDT